MTTKKQKRIMSRTLIIPMDFGHNGKDFDKRMMDMGLILRSKKRRK